MAVKQKSFSERRAENEQRLKDVGGGVYAPKPQTSSTQRYVPVASSRGGGVIFQDQFTGQTNVVGDVESVSKQTFDDGSTQTTTNFNNLRYSNAFVSPSSGRRATAMPSQDPYIPASQVDGNRFVIRRVAENQPSNTLGSVGQAVAQAGPFLQRGVEKGLGVNNDRTEKSPAFILASQVARDTRYTQTSRQAFSREDIASGFGTARPVLDFVQFQSIKASEKTGIGLPNPKVTRDRFVREYQEQGAAFGAEYRRVKPTATQKEVANAYELYFRRQSASEAGTEAILTGGVGASSELLGRGIISSYRIARKLPAVASRSSSISSVLGITKRTLNPAISRAKLSAAVAGSTATAGAYEGAATYYIQSATMGQKPTKMGALQSVALGAVSAGTISTAQTRLATSSSRFLRGRGEKTFSAAVNILDPQEPVSDSLANLYAKTVSRPNTRVRTFLTEPSLTQTESNFPSYVFNSPKSQSSARVIAGANPFTSTRSSIATAISPRASPSISSVIGSRPSTSSRTTARSPISTYISPRPNPYVSSRPTVSSRTNINPRVLTPQGLFGFPRMGGASRGVGSVLGVTSQKAQYARSLSSAYFRRSAGKGSAASVTGLGIR